MSDSTIQFMIKAIDRVSEPVLLLNKFFDLSPIERIKKQPFFGKPKFDDDYVEITIERN
jgi:hypothetical protein